MAMDKDGPQRYFEVDGGAAAFSFVADAQGGFG